jgi:hypothetical protein
MLPLPQYLGLSDAQRRGTVCVWCSEPLTAETARDLGERPAPDGTRMWPRGCTPCVHTTARRIYNLHARHCARCLRNTEPCPDRRALHDLALEGRRRGGQL